MKEIPGVLLVARRVGRSSEVPSAAVDNSALFASHPQSTHKSGEVVQTNGATSLPEIALIAIWVNLFGRRELSLHDDFFELGGDLQLAIDAINQIEERLGAIVSLEKFFELRTIARLALFIGVPNGAAFNIATPLIAINSEAPRRLYVVPGLGLTSNWFFPLARELSGQIQVLCFEAGASQIGALRTNINEIAVDYAMSIEKRTPMGAIVIAGHSYGGAIAFETARVLQCNGRDVTLWLLDSSLIMAFSKVKPPEMDTHLQRFSLLRWGRALPSMEGLVARQLRGYVAYKPSGTFNGRVVAVLAEQGLVAGGLLKFTREALKLWTRESVKWVHVPGTHFSMLASENVSHLATIITKEGITWSSPGKQDSAV